MKVDQSLRIQIASILQEIGTPACSSKAQELLKSETPLRVLHLRDLGLDATSATAILSCLKQEDLPIKDMVSSISFSYNPSFGDAGAQALVTKLPESIVELGLVGCGITDLGGKAILSWLRRSPHAHMICLEQNCFSESFKSQLKSAGIGAMVVV